MYISYKKLWMKLAGLEMRKKDLCKNAGISMAPLTKMGKGGHVTSEILMKICIALDCTFDDIAEIVREDE